MSAAVLEALRLLRVYTAGSLDVWALAGSQKASCRAHVMSALLGRKARQAESGVNALRQALYAAVGAEGDCLAHQQADFARRAALVA